MVEEQRQMEGNGRQRNEYKKRQRRKKFAQEVADKYNKNKEVRDIKENLKERNN